MDKIFSARLSESVVLRIGHLARRLNTTKKNVLESAVELYAAKIESEKETDVLAQTFGSWKRDETALETAGKARKAFRESMTRHNR